MRIIRALGRGLSRTLAICWLPALLVVVFVIQNNLFNAWLGIPGSNYLLRGTVAMAALGVLIYGPALLFNKHLKYPYLVLVSLLVAAIFFVQYLYYSYSGGFLQASALFYAKEGMTDLGTVKILLSWRMALFAVNLPIVIFVWILAKFKDKLVILNHPFPVPSSILGGSREYINSRLSMGGIKVRGSEVLTKKQKLVAGVAIIALVVGGYGYFFHAEKNDPENVAYIFRYGQLFDVNGLVGKVGIVNFFLSDAIALAMHANNVSAADLAFAKEYENETVAVIPGKDFGELKGRNAIFIQVESLDNSVIGQKIGDEEITPNLNKLAADGLYFSNYYSPIGPGTTADAEFMTMNSLYSLPDTVAFIKYSYDNYDALPVILKKNGYGTYSMHGDQASFWNRASIYPQLGYEKWFSADDYTIPRKIGNYDLGDKDFFNQSLPKLEALPQPFMVTLITLTSHTPFVIPSDLQTLAIPASSNLTWLQTQYLQSVHYSDQAIGDFIGQLKTAGLYDNSVIFIWGDHGSSTGIAGALGVKNSVFPDLQASQVPLIILAPGTSIKGVNTAPANHLDVYPTVADLLGINPPAYVFGHDLIEGGHDLAVSRNLVSGTVKSILTDTLAFHDGSDGKFSDGQCLSMPSEKVLEVDVCKPLYDKETEAVRVSDIMVKGNVIGMR